MASGNLSSVEGIVMILSDSVCIFRQKTKTTGTPPPPTKNQQKQQEKQQKTCLYGVDITEKLRRFIGPCASSLLPRSGAGSPPSGPHYPTWWGAVILRLPQTPPKSENPSFLKWRVSRALSAPPLPRRRFCGGRGRKKAGLETPLSHLPWFLTLPLVRFWPRGTSVSICVKWGAYTRICWRNSMRWCTCTFLISRSFPHAF